MDTTEFSAAVDVLAELRAGVFAHRELNKRPGTDIREGSITIRAGYMDTAADLFDKMLPYLRALDTGSSSEPFRYIRDIVVTFPEDGWQGVIYYSLNVASSLVTSP